MWQVLGEILNSSSRNLSSSVTLSHATEGSLITKPVHDFEPHQMRWQLGWLVWKLGSSIAYIPGTLLSVLQVPLVWGRPYVRPSCHHRSILRDFQSLARKHSRSNARKPLNVDIILKTMQSNHLVNKRLSSPVPQSHHAQHFDSHHDISYLIFNIQVPLPTIRPSDS